MTSELPPPKLSQAYVHASVLEAGHVRLNEMFVIKDGSPTTTMVPSMAFFLRHSQNDKTMVFDLGLRKDWENYPPAVVDAIKAMSKLDIPVDVVESLHRGGIEPDQVDFVVLSHMHCDHIGNPDLFPTSQFIVGGECKALLAKGYSSTDTEPALEPDFAKNLLPEGRTTFISSNDWTPVGPFPRAHDFFGDGSVYLIDAPGHLDGHINLLARTSTEGSWLYLGGDSVHDLRLLTGEKDIAVFSNPVTGLVTCLHADVEMTKKHISRIRHVRENPKVLVLMAHDVQWYSENKDIGVIFPGKIKPL